jgi:hypothetical protein
MRIARPRATQKYAFRASLTAYYGIHKWKIDGQSCAQRVGIA